MLHFPRLFFLGLEQKIAKALYWLGHVARLSSAYKRSRFCDKQYSLYWEQLANST